MPIRRRGTHWQVDIRTAEGTRIRRQYETEAQAIAAEAAMKPNPQQRAEMRKLRRKLSARLKSPDASASPSSDIVDISTLKRLESATSRLSAAISKPAPLAIVEVSSSNSGGYSGPSGPGLPVSQASRRSKA